MLSNYNCPLIWTQLLGPAKRIRMLDACLYCFVLALDPNLLFLVSRKSECISLSQQNPPHSPLAFRKKCSTLQEMIFTTWQLDLKYYNIGTQFSFNVTKLLTGSGNFVRSSSNNNNDYLTRNCLIPHKFVNIEIIVFCHIFDVILNIFCA